MHDKSKIIFILYFVTNHVPEGIDQVEAAEKCHNFAVENEQDLSTHAKAMEIVAKIKRKYPIFKIQHFLYTYGVADDKLLQLVESPRDLIRALYHHDSILRDQKVEINSCVVEIANLFGINYELLQVQLLEKWLKFQFYSESSGLESVLEETQGTPVSQHDEDCISDESVKRAYYILKDWPPEKAIRVLALQIWSQDSKSSTGKQLQLIECFTKLLNSEVVVDSTYDDLTNQDYYNVLKCVHHLRQLGYKFTVEKFKETDKLALLKQIWTKHAQVAQGLELLVFICLSFDINEAPVWNGILKQMVKLDMMDQLTALVHILSTKAELLHIPGLAAAWTAAIKAPFKQATTAKVNPAEKEAMLVKALILLQSCPVSANLSLVELTEICLRLERPHMATVFLAFVKGEEQEKILTLLKPFKSPKLRAAISELSEHGINPNVINLSVSLLFN